ncbi:MMPL family transporter [Luteimonas huabeiensis]|uniref:MMPL family transporter n=1 Tax=Luteimonas huabeiensis TaxID=1244513 RepID=UPI0004B65C28|nr:MMPL family transporter [Luteimonas huabeiensis]
MKPASQWALALLWAALLAAVGIWAAQRLQVSGDLRAFMPAPETSAQRLLIEELGDGPGARLLLIGLSGAPAETLAAQSAALRARLAGAPSIEFVANGGDDNLDAIPARLLPYRYLLTDAFDAAPLDAETLRDALDARLQDLGSPAAALVEPLLPSDPTLEVLRLAERWEPEGAPTRREGVWFDADGTEALLVVRTRAAGFDPAAQAGTVEAIRRAFEAVSAGSGSRMTLTGPGAFSVEIGARTAAEAGRIGAIGTLGLVLLFVFAYRSARLLLLGVLPLATAGLAGLAAVAALFDGVHGITLAFGFTLIGVAQDYPVHVFSHLHGRQSPRAIVRALWPTLLTGVVSTCIAYLTFFVSGVEGLRQLAVFTIVGLVAAAASTRYLLPPLLEARAGDVGQAPWVDACARAFDRVPRPRPWLLAALALAAVATAAFAPGPFWENDLSKLTPVPEQGMRDDARLRAALGAPDVRYLMTLEAPSEDAALAASERLLPVLDGLVAEGALGSYDLAARYLPSAATQRARQARLPAPDALRAVLDDALAGTPFRPDAFAPFLADVETARTAAPLTARDLAGTPLDASVSGLLLPGEGRVTALVALGGLEDPARVAAAAAAHGAHLVDLKETSESLVSAWRGGVLASLGLAALLLAATVWAALRRPRRVWRVLLPMGLTLLLTLGLLRAFGIELTLFHLVSLILAAGLGLDYALFFERAAGERAEHLRTLHAVLVCSSMTALVFGLLALSSIPVLRAIGLTVAIGVVANFVLAVLLAGHAGADAEATR